MGNRGLDHVSVRGLRELAAGAGVPVTVRGGCMEPHLPDGRRVEVRAARRLWPGDVVAVAAAGRPLSVHRVVGYRRFHGGWRLVTAGDAAPGPDRPVRPAQVIGRVVMSIPFRHRVRALWRFAGWSLAAAARRLCG